MEKIQEEIARKEQEIRNLESSLSSSSSEIGDYKIIKCMECKALNLPMPYDLEDLRRKRQAVRDKINALQEDIVRLRLEIYMSKE